MKSEVFLMDCMDGMKQYPDKYFDLAVVDPPYGIGASAPTKKGCTVKQKNGTVLHVSNPNYEKKDWDFKMSYADYFNELKRVSKNQIIWGGNYYGLIGGYLTWNKINHESDQFGNEGSKATPSTMQFVILNLHHLQLSPCCARHACRRTQDRIS